MSDGIYQSMKDAMDRIPKTSTHVFYANPRVVDQVRKVQIESLTEQVEKLKTRRDNWRRRYEQAQTSRCPGWLCWFCIGYTITDIVTVFIL